MEALKAPQEGMIVKSNAGLYDVYIAAEDIVVQTKSRGVLRHQKKQPLVGDYVLLEFWEQTPVITTILPRKNELVRPLIANIDSCLVVISVKEPTFQQYLLDKYLALLEFNAIAPYLVFTKCDLLTDDEMDALGVLQSYYEQLGYPCFCVNDKKLLAEERLRDLLSHKIAAVMGQTGVGKTTLLNALSHNAWGLKTNAISKALGRGKHTTRIVELFAIDTYWIADTPGFSSFRVDALPAKALTNTFVEFARYPCQFSDCVHINEKQCGVKTAVKNNEILPSRYENYRKLYEELKVQEDNQKW